MDASFYLPENPVRQESGHVAAIPPRYARVGEILAVVARAFGFTESELLGRERSRSLVEARHCLYLVARQCTRCSLPELGIALGRDHSTVLYGCRSARKLMARDARWARTVNELLEQFGGAV